MGLVAPTVSKKRLRRTRSAYPLSRTACAITAPLRAPFVVLPEATSTDHGWVPATQPTALRLILYGGASAARVCSVACIPCTDPASACLQYLFCRLRSALWPSTQAVEASSSVLSCCLNMPVTGCACPLWQVGLSNRAMELFDWLRGLEPSHDLAALCDVYTCALLTLCPQGEKEPS